jgi:hypothetical protein
LGENANQTRISGIKWSEPGFLGLKGFTGRRIYFGAIRGICVKENMNPSGYPNLQNLRGKQPRMARS